MNQSRAEQLYRRYRARQPSNRFGPSYQPAIKAIRAEAPRKSKLYQVDAHELCGRRLHLLSTPEMHAALVAMWHPYVCEIQEQRLLPTRRSPHPLDGHPEILPGIELPHMEGSTRILDDMGELSHHAWATVSVEGERCRVPLPYVSDLLIICRAAGSIYGVAWSIKAAAQDFQQAFGARRHARNPQRSTHRAMVRHEMERRAWSSAGIPYRQISGDQIPRQVVANLQWAFCLSRGFSADSDRLEEGTHLLSRCMAAGVAPMRVAARAERLGFQGHQFLRLIAWAVWTRKLLVDMTRPILSDRPLRPSVSEHFESEWFLP